ncbi:NAD(P)/FAD-dependent oxidoreductase [Aureimonas sp. AU12]|uniref:FAD-dependent oxidoreductase n=1 Tax=Aureimonas sp. AU12 TaxID=1638161 RepID=UPI000786026A|nr:NAD(P)/FAD-dependent oxidoreductase [Aureimonas sp. AU12]
MPEARPSALTGQKIVIVGAGLAGTLCAIMLAQRGARVEIIERQTFDPTDDYSNRRSFNITVSSRGEAAMKAAGIWDRVKARTIPITGRTCHEGLGSTFFSYSPDRSVALHGARRSDVNGELLAAAAEHEGITVRFGWTLRDLDKASGAVTIAPVAGDGPAETIRDADFVIGADGVYSAVRRFIHRGERADFTQRYLDWNYREIAIPAGTDANHPWLMDPHALHVWPRGDLMMFALPNPDGSFTGNFIYPCAKEADFAAIGLVGEMFRREFPDVAALVPDAEERLRVTPPSYFPTQRNSKWSHGDRFVLVGDAAHATVPFYGQGMNSAFESVLELVACLERFPRSERARAFEAYQTARKPHTDAVADLSIENFDELRSRFRHVVPQARRRVEILLNRLLPNAFVPLHVKVSHSLEGYRTAIDACARRDRILRWFGFDLLVYAVAGVGLAGTALHRVWHGGTGLSEHLAQGRAVAAAHVEAETLMPVDPSTERPA